MPKSKTLSTKTGSPKTTTARLTAPEFILALDMSLEHTGYALSHLPTNEVTKGLIEPNGVKGMARLAFLRDKILELAYSGSSMLVLLEGYSYGSNGASVVSLGELGGVIRLALFQAEVLYIEVAPGSLKKFVAGKGNAPKQIMLKEVFKRFGEDIDDDNVADAFSLMQLGLAVVGKNPRPLVAFQEQVVSDVVKTYLKAHPELAEGAAA